MNSRLLPYRVLFPNYDKIIESKILVVGAGGIGCELLKNLVLSGFKHIEIIDLDTIDVSNLNRQFLFRSHHVGKPKSYVARETALAFNPHCNIISHHGKIESPQFNVNYFESFALVMNALDNVAARQHVNRMCLAAEVPLLDGGTAGYLGQVITIKKEMTECYECQPKQRQKSFAVCTIRSNPSTLLHCVVWAKMLFERLFGKSSDENAIADFEKIQTIENATMYACAAFDLVFEHQIEEVANMKDASIFHTGMKPVVINRKEILEKLRNSQIVLQDILSQDREVWSLSENCLVFLDIGRQLRERKTSSQEEIAFDKDDEMAMSFVTAASNLRAWNYHIDMKSRYEIKGMAGNIVPAIATTNAIISGLLVLEAYKVISNELDKCRAIYCLRNPSRYRRKNCLIYPISLEAPNPECYICSSNELVVKVNCKDMTLGQFISKVLRENLGLIEPSITFNKSILYEIGEELDEDEVEEYKKNEKMKLIEFGIGSTDRSTLGIEDYAQELDWKVIIVNDDRIAPQDATIIGKMQFEKKSSTAPGTSIDEERKENESGPILNTIERVTYKSSDDGVLDLISDDEIETTKKRKREDDSQAGEKRRKVGDDNHVIILD